MEVHAHTHTARKKWTHYFWEFLMLFLAVFCGFLAEYQLEHTIEHQREKDYIQSMIEDLKKDTANFTHVINDFMAHQQRLSALLNGFNNNMMNHSDEWANDFIVSVKSGYKDFYYTDRTLQQLKNSGGLRLIRNKEAANGIIDYDAAIKDYYTEEKFLSDAQWRYIETVDKLWSYREMFADMKITQWKERSNQPIRKNYWTTGVKDSFDYLYNKMAVLASFFGQVTKQLQKTRKQAEELIILLTREYHLK